MILTYKYRVKGKRARRQLRRFAWAANQVWNYCVQTQRKVQRTWKDGLPSKWPSHYDLQRLTAGTSKALAIHAQSVQGVCEQFTVSRDQHHKRPRFRKSSGSKRSLGWVPFQKQSRSTTPSSVTYLGNTYNFFGAKRRPLPNTAKGGSFVEDARGNWYVCLHVEVAADKHSGVDAVGIDLGLKNLAATSDGDIFEAPQYFRRSQEQLAVAQRAGNVQRAKAINAHIKNQRVDYLHKLSSKVVERYGAIYVGNVSASSLGKTRMAKSVYDAGWSTFREMLRYKASRHGASFAIVDESFSSQRCSTCGIIPTSSPKGIADVGVREWRCSSCGASHNRDVNAAKNILITGRSATPLAEGSRVAHGR